VPSVTLFTFVESPVGRLLLAGTGNSLSRLHFSQGSKARDADPSWVESPGSFADASRQIDDYFNGRLRRFQLPLQPEGTPFQLAVWNELMNIPYGATITYGELAKRLGNPAASRAVGLANASNPIAIIQPCHRVIGANGKLTGFGGGLDVKQKLLDLERGERTLF
jgi:methylated-DNA-[protein]-cysteine S-methyltransferase